MFFARAETRLHGATDWCVSLVANHPHTSPRQDCEEFDKKVEKLRGEKEKRMEECLGELRGLEDGYRQRHRDAKQVTTIAQPTLSLRFC